MKKNFLKCLVMLWASMMSLNTFAVVALSLKYTNGEKTKIYQTNSKNVDLEFGDEIKTIIVNEPGNFKIYLETETSVTIMDEGPHLDLTDFKHGKSKMAVLEKNENEFTFLDLSKEIEFPEVSIKELVEEARKIGGEEWAQIAKKCKTPHEYPCKVSPSRHTLKVEKEVDGKWIDQGSLILIPPMGC